MVRIAPCILLICGAPAAIAAPVRIDLCPALGRNDTATPGWNEWQVAEGRSASRAFRGVTVTLRQIGKDDEGLATFWRKAGLVHGATMTIDGVSAAHDGPRGGFQIVLSGLSSGRHTLVTYHNSIWDKPVSAQQVLIDGRMLADVRPTERVRDNADAASAFVEFEVDTGRDVIVQIRPDGSGQINKAILNGFEIDAVDPKRKAVKPFPAHLDEHVDGDAGTVMLSWTPAAAAVRHNVYFASATDPEDAHAALAAAKPGSPTFVGAVESHYVEADVVDNDSLRHYCWRVDTIDASGNVTRGDIWRFRVRHRAFPGAEGYGRFARGGRGGRIIEVTNLDDSGPGSLRAAVEAEGSRTVVFNVSGLITLKSKLVFRNPYLTVAGQTAPGKGICIRDWTFGGLGARDTIIRYVRVRLGNRAGKTMDGMGLASCNNCILDHCSISWTIDEALSSRGAGNVTVQRTLISEALNEAGHEKYPPGTRHGYAASIGGDIGSFHHNLLAHCAGRNWSLAGGLDKAGRHTGRLDIRNNVIYNWHHRTTDGGAMEVNFVSNYYKPGPASKVFHLLKPERNRHFGPQRYYVRGNIMEGRYGAEDPLAGVVEPRDEPLAGFMVDIPFFPPHVSTQSAREAYEDVLADVGCNVPVLDSHDRRVIEEVRKGVRTYVGSRTRMPGIIDSQEDVGGWEDHPVIRRRADWDTDHDGMPNFWEFRRGLDPTDPADGPADPDGDGYTNLEDYLSGLVAR